MTTLAATTPVLLPPATRIILMYKMRSGLESPHYKLPDPQSLVSVIATEFHGPSNHYKQDSLALLRPGCDVTPPSVPSSRLMWMQENDFKARFEPCSL